MNEAIPPDRDQSLTGAEPPSDEEPLYPDPETRSLLEKAPEEDAQLPKALREHLRKLAADLARQAEKEQAELRNGLPDPILRLIGDLPEAPLADAPQADVTSAAQVRPEVYKRSALWRVTFQISREDDKMLTVEVRRPMVIGRMDPRAATHPDLDFSVYGALELGMSRQHAILLPAADGLWLIDLDSTNGTRVNDHYLHPGLRYRLHEGDQIDFGALQVRVSALKRIRAARRPKGTT